MGWRVGQIVGAGVDSWLGTLAEGRAKVFGPWPPVTGMSAPKSAKVGRTVGRAVGANDGAGVGAGEGPTVGLLVG